MESSAVRRPGPDLGEAIGCILQVYQPIGATALCAVYVSVDHDSGIPLEYFDEPASDGVDTVLSVTTPWVARPMLSPHRCASVTKAPQPSVGDVLVEAA